MISVNFVEPGIVTVRYNGWSKRSITSYTNDLHEALLAKDGPVFWKSWRSKFETRANCSQVGGCVDQEVIANNFAHYFADTYSPNSTNRAAALLHEEYLPLRESYFGYQ